jgi:hypothetical protein
MHGALACSLVVVELGEALSPLEHNPGEVLPQILQSAGMKLRTFKFEWLNA